MRSIQGVQIPVHSELSPWGIAITLLLVGGLFMRNEAMLRHQLQVNSACGAAAGLWEALLYVRLNFDVIELAFALVLFLKGQHVKLKRAAVFSLGISLKAVFTVLLLQWAVARTPSDADLNTKYCDWRAKSACWQTPNTTLETYELLFPVTQSTLFRRELAHPFRPLETRYEVSVLWNAMARCRDYSSQDSDKSLPTVYDSLSTDKAVDAWCGAMHLPRDQDGKLLVSYDAINSPAQAYGKAVATTCREMHTKIRGFVMLHWALVAVLVFASHLWPTTRASKTTNLTTQPANTDKTAAKSSAAVYKAKTGDQLRDANAPLPVVDPSWVEVQS